MHRDTLQFVRCHKLYNPLYLRVAVELKILYISLIYFSRMFISFLFQWVLLIDFPCLFGGRGSAVVKVLCYKSEGCWFDPFRSHYGPGVDSASNRNEYQEYYLGVKAASA